MTASDSLIERTRFGPTGWEPGGKRVVAALRGLTRAERKTVAAGYVCDQRPTTNRNLEHKGMFYLHIDSPNGRCGFMKLTPLGENVRKLLKAKEASQ
jgi:hypothetical protein